MSKKRDTQIDILYSIGVFLVLLGHSHPSDWNSFSGTFFYDLIVFIYTFHMPLFFFISGYLFMNSNSLENIGYEKWIKNKAIRLLTPYIVLSVVALIPKYYLEHHSFVTIDYLIEAVLKPRVGVWGHFWFIPVLLLCYILFGAWHQLVTEKNKSMMLLAVTVFSFVLYFLPFSTQWLGLGDLKEACIFFCIGMNLKQILPMCKEYSKWIRYVWIVVTVLAAVALDRWARKKAVMLIVAVLMISACWQLAKVIGNSKLALWVSNHNFTIYIYSWPCQAVIMGICGRLGMPWYFMSVFMLFAGIFGPISVILLYEKLDCIHNRMFDLILGMK